MLVNEVLSRPMRDRRAVARYAGLTGALDESGAKRREQGLATAGNARDRRGMIQLSWRFLRFQKNSALAPPEVKWSIYPFGGRVPHRNGRESRRPARMLTALGRSCAGAGVGGVFSREHSGQALVRHPDEGVHLAKFPGKLAPGIARIDAAEDLTVDATGQQKIGVGSVRGQVPDRAVGGYW